MSAVFELDATAGSGFLFSCEIAGAVFEGVLEGVGAADRAGVQRARIRPATFVGRVACQHTVGHYRANRWAPNAPAALLAVSITRRPGGPLR